MWSRAELKVRAKISFKSNYWKAVIVGLLATILSGSITSFGGKKQAENFMHNGVNSLQVQPLDLLSALLVSGVVLILIILVILIAIFILNPLKVGCCNFFLTNRRTPGTDLGTLGIGFDRNYKNNVLVMFMTELFIFLWSLLFIIPGIIKAYEYRLVPYILCEYPDISYNDAQTLSKQLMRGQKWEAFVLDISFIGWAILGAITFGLLNLFYVNPYIEATYAELYVELAHPEERNVVHSMPDNVTTVDFTVEK